MTTAMRQSKPSETKTRKSKGRRRETDTIEKEPKNQIYEVKISLQNGGDEEELGKWKILGRVREAEVETKVWIGRRHCRSLHKIFCEPFQSSSIWHGEQRFSEKIGNEPQWW